MNKHRKHIVLSDVHLDIVENLIETVPGVNNLSEAIRYALLGVSGKIEGQLDNRKINSMSKQIDILVEMVAGGLDQLDVKAIGRREDTYIYQDAKKNVENSIQKSTTTRQSSENMIAKKRREIV